MATTLCVLSLWGPLRAGAEVPLQTVNNCTSKWNHGPLSLEMFQCPNSLGFCNMEAIALYLDLRPIPLP